jgi:hypothetical protein
MEARHMRRAEVRVTRLEEVPDMREVLEWID